MKLAATATPNPGLFGTGNVTDAPSPLALSDDAATRFLPMQGAPALSQTIPLGDQPALAGGPTHSRHGPSTPRAGLSLAQGLFGADLGSFALAAALLAPTGTLGDGPAAYLALVAVATLLLFTISGLYPGTGIWPHELLRRRVVSVAKVTLLAVPGALVLSGGWRGATLVLSFMVIALIFQPGLRALARSALARRVVGEVLAVPAPAAHPPARQPGGRTLHTAARDRTARVLDLTVAGIALLLAAPVLLLACAAVYAADPGPVIFRQTREGRGGRTFPMLKLRTMYRDADRRLEALLAADPAARAEWAAHFKLRNDPRVLPVIGRLLRASSIDELPQLINVIRGDMRVVGPRPFPLYHLDAMDPAFRARRCTVTPGLTGLWQISGRSTADIARQQELDLFYIENRSFWLDLHILISTAAAVARGEGAY